MLGPEPLRRELVTANHILAREGLLDGFGHLSVRHPDSTDHLLISRPTDPGTVAATDIQTIAIRDVRARAAGQSYLEVPIHSAIYRRRHDVAAICHSHTASVLPFCVTGTPLRPLWHVAALMGVRIPVWDMESAFGPTDLLVRTDEQGDHLARALGSATVVLMRGHGCVIVGGDLRSVVFTAIQLQANARVQLQAERLGAVHFLSAEEVALAARTHASASVLDRAWRYWERRAGDDMVGHHR